MKVNGKRFVVIMAMMLLSIGAQAQGQMIPEVKAPSRTPGFRGSLSIHTNLDPYRVYDWKSFGSEIGGISGMKDLGLLIPSMGVGLNGGFTGRWITLNVNGRMNFGTAFVKGAVAQEHIDMMAYLDFGIRLLKLWVVELEVNGGFGACFPNIGNKSASKGETHPYLSSTHMIAPISAILWFGGARRARHRVGLSLEYIFRLGKFSELPNSPIDAISDVANQVGKSPATINASLRYQF